MLSWFVHIEQISDERMAKRFMMEKRWVVEKKHDKSRLYVKEVYQTQQTRVQRNI